MLLPGKTLHVRDLHSLIEKFVQTPSTGKTQRDLRFPIERHYSEYGASRKNQLAQNPDYTH